MKLNYIFTMPYDFLMQAVKILHYETQTNDEMNLAYDFVTMTEIDTLRKYNKKCMIVSYENDLELFIEIINKLLIIFESIEEYEKCQKLLDKKILSEKIMNGEI